MVMMMMKGDDDDDNGDDGDDDDDDDEEEQVHHYLHGFAFDLRYRPTQPDRDKTAQLHHLEQGNI